MEKPRVHKQGIRQILFDVIFGVESRAGKLFDIVLICMILASVAAVLVDSVAAYHARYGALLAGMEWFFTLAFTLEYLLRIYSYPQARKYIFSFYGIIDLVSILPTYIAFLYPSAAYLLVIRVLRVLRIFRILKLFRYIGEANMLFAALYNSRRKIFVFVFSISTLIVIFGALMFIVEGPANGFNNIPVAIYWAIVTVTTVGYGDISPQTPLGQAIAALAMICGYAVIAVPTGIVSAELMQEFRRERMEDDRVCKACNKRGHVQDAAYCSACGEKL